MDGNETGPSKSKKKGAKGIKYGSGRIPSNASKRPWSTPLNQRPHPQRLDSGSFKNPNLGKGADNFSLKTEVVSKKLSSGFGFRRLEALSKLAGREIMEILAKKQTMTEFASLAAQPDLKDDFILRIVIVLGKLSRNEFDEIVVQSLCEISGSIFINQLLNYIVRYQEDEDLEETAYQEAFEFFDNLSAYCHAVTRLLPTLACERLAPVMRQSSLLLNSMCFTGIEKVRDIMNINLEMLAAEKEKRKVQPKKTTLAEEALQVSAPPEDFRELSTVPMTNDLLRHRFTYLRPCIVQGPYRNVEHYLDVQFRLLREDFVRPLRDGIREYIEKKNDAAHFSGKARRIRVNNIKIYEGVLIGETQIVEDKVGFYVFFDPQKKFCPNINWDQSKRFMNESLLIFTDNQFETILLAKVLTRRVEDLSKGKVLIQVLDEVHDGKTLCKTWLMAESSLFYGAYSHVLEALQKFNEINFPLIEYIVEGKSDPQMPAYLDREPTPLYKLPLPSVSKKKKIDENADALAHGADSDAEDVDVDVGAADAEAMNYLEVNPKDNGSWPSASDLGLDDSQYEAFRGALTQKVMLIQGPPGTGKTYLGLRIASVLLTNSDYWQSDVSGGRPIVVVCYTNHALDQFLMGLTPLTNSIVRVGGGCKEKSLDKFSIRNLRFNRDLYQRGRNLAGMMREYREKLAALKEQYLSIEETKAAILSDEGIIDPECLHNYGVLPIHQLFSFNDRNDFMMWLEEGFHMKHLNKRLGMNLYQPISKDSQNENERNELFFIVGFRNLAFNNLNQDESATYYQQKKMYLVHQLKSPLTKPELLDINKVEKVRSLKQLPVEMRWQLYRVWVNELSKIFTQKANDLLPKLLKAAANLKQARMVEEEDVMSTCKVIGMTTSYAASRQAILKQLRPRIVIVEEAAEVLEAHVVVSLTGSCEHLIMIGDHLQLKPNPAVYELATKYHLNVSLFERLINNKVQCVSLTTQHRMRPEIARLVSPAIYPILYNHESVSRYPPVKGVTRNVAFIHHQNHQEAVEEIQSFRNIHEAHFISSLVRYLRLQGYGANQITVLATYKGQMFYLNKLRQENSLLADVRITVVDNYQGEENDIILLSLVRSNNEGDVGFLKIENRVCVALSRAKHGLFIIGNMDNMVCKGEIWPKISLELREQNALVEALELRCDVHSTITQVSSSDDFKNVPEGGCLRQCGSLMPCGHICAQMCHATDREHTTFKCFEPCPRPVCVKNHTCPDKCFMDCKPCMVPTDVTLPCGHKTEIPCHVKPAEYKCLEVIPFTLVMCNHQRDILCYESKNSGEIVCREPCVVRLDCGHACTRTCHLLDDPDHEEYKCTKPCALKNIGCTDEHYCQKTCHQDCEECVIMVVKKLPCGHKWTMKCCEQPSRQLCGNKCLSTNACGHKCKKTCKEDCNPCLTKVEKIIPYCGHKQMICCGIDPASFNQCSEKCDRFLACGHKCTNKCCEDCVTQCQEKIPYPKPTGCGHSIMIPCYKKNVLEANSDELLKLCQEPCSNFLQPCMHKCPGTCGTCWQGRLHKACSQPCGRVLVCGHSCKAPCAQNCPPCNAPCQVKCQHSECPRKCGLPCAPCKETCGRKCPHTKCRKQCSQMCNIRACKKPCGRILKKCKHKCVGLCGDVCICEECNEGIRELFFGTEEEENARFVMLPDCQHIFESTGLEQWLEGGHTKTKEIKQKVCPKCTTPIQTCMRYIEILMEHNRDVQTVKYKLFGNVHLIKNKAATAMKYLTTREDKGFPKELSECISLGNVVFTRLSTVGKNQKRERGWFQPPLSLTEVESLRQYSCIVNTLATLGRKALLEKNTGFTMNEKCKTEVVNFMNKIGSNLKARNLVRLSDQEAKDIGCLLKRLESLILLCFIESSPNFSVLTASSKQSYLPISAIVRGCSLYLESKHSENFKILKKVADEVKVVITQAEIRSVVSAMGMAKGHWFKCPNGHVYAIGDCGGAMQEGHCNECGKRIGGGSHRLRGDNSFAPEIDGAAAPAWPGALH